MSDELPSPLGHGVWTRPYLGCMRCIVWPTLQSRLSVISLRSLLLSKYNLAAAFLIYESPVPSQSRLSSQHPSNGRHWVGCLPVVLGVSGFMLPISKTLV